MGNVIRLTNGGQIQVRTGVLQGIGPVGPPGVTGPTGPQGESGPQGSTGPAGAISTYFTKASIAGTTSLATNTDVLLSFGTVNRDDLAAHSSSTAITFSQPGIYQINAWARFDLPANAGDSIRSIFIQSTTQGLLARHGLLAVADEASYVSLTWTDAFSAGEVVNIYGRHSDDLSVGVSAGAYTVTRLGSGPAGVQGIQGPAGPVGPAGPPGPTGATGSASTGFATYADL